MLVAVPLAIRAVEGVVQGHQADLTQVEPGDRQLRRHAPGGGQKPFGWGSTGWGSFGWQSLGRGSLGRGSLDLVGWHVASFGGAA